MQAVFVQKVRMKAQLVLELAAPVQIQLVLELAVLMQIQLVLELTVLEEQIQGQ